MLEININGSCWVGMMAVVALGRKAEKGVWVFA